MIKCVAVWDMGTRMKKVKNDFLLVVNKADLEEANETVRDP